MSRSEMACLVIAAKYKMDKSLLSTHKEDTQVCNDCNSRNIGKTEVTKMDYCFDCGCQILTLDAIDVSDEDSFYERLNDRFFFDDYAEEYIFQLVMDTDWITKVGSNVDNVSRLIKCFKRDLVEVDKEGVIKIDEKSLGLYLFLSSV